MKVIDAHTGLEVRVGMKIPLPTPGVFSTPESSRSRMADLTDHYYQVLDIYPGVLRASMAIILVEGSRRQLVMDAPLQVRWTHPGYFLQHVAFVPT